MRLIRIALSSLLWVVVAFCLTATVVPFFLDRIYYRGPVTSHFDGQRFFNPDGDALELSNQRRNRLLWQQAFGDPTRPKWPARVAVTPARPPARVEGGAMRVTWIGHATVLVQADGVNILTDPVWSDTVGPFGFGPRRVAEPGVRFEGLPRIDLVLVSHNHYDHMDLPTLKRLWERDHPLVVTSLGNDKVIASAGVTSRALDWGQRVALRPGVAVTVTRSHHWGSRWFADRSRALWSSFVVTLPHGNFFFAGDTGLGDGKWPAEAAALGPVRFAAIPIGAFRFDEGQLASGSHIGPPDAIRVWDGLGRPNALAVHWGTFRLSREGYATPPKVLRGMMQCAGEDPARFAAHPIGQGFDVPPIGAAPRAPDHAGLDACIRNGAFDALR
ncbi:MBL fold metallo-hydrolase [Sphingomonas kyeonggiensis]|uniref:L-ascorbate metabolism protein UlaG (Beta-lactamase superfamily) n=1 Tax=Sphingomonas kyeonggiensis TaxID=1268553 RepID=A0A7W6NZP9_9SPHN|nr:MBL fold metallo-hydrolase [Sphingomonas kyeonggiensis]MBB4100869.1 L-ascorbate metabolism protein UlaG (beta-lactamase superfamily) [Sphingomonas kyeonggiensis]